MINTKKELKYYLQEDAKALGINRLGTFKRFVKKQFDKRIRFHIELRKYENRSNVLSQKVGGHKIFVLPMFLYHYYVFKKLSYTLGYTIHKNCFGPGLNIKHYGSVVVNPHTRVGKNCVIHTCVNIGETNGKAPVIGDNVYLGPGVKMFGDIKIGNYVTIGANAVVNKSFEQDNITLVGVPAHVVKKMHRETISDIL